MSKIIIFLTVLSLDVIIIVYMGFKDLDNLFLLSFPIMGFVFIRFPEFISDYRGPIGQGGHVDAPTPEIIVRATGWTILSIPILLLIYNLFKI